MMTTPPPGLAVMTEKRRWVGFRRETRPGETKPTKVPYQVARDERGRDQKAKAGDLATFDTFPAVAEAVAAGRFDGFGYELMIEDGIFFLDLDGVRDPETHRLTPLARSAVSLLNTYAAPSISGTGVHVYGIGQLPAELLTGGREGRKIGNFELYAGKHFATETFQPFPGYDVVREVDADTMRRLVLLLWPDEFGRHGEDRGSIPTSIPPAPIDLDDAAVLAKAFAGEGGEDFRRRHAGVLILGNTSDDDFGYLSTLRFYTQANPGQMRRIALSSARARDKWFSKRGAVDWLDYSITHIIERDQGKPVYDPGRGKGYNVTITPDKHDNVISIPADCLARVAQLERDLADHDRTIARLEGEVARLTARVGELETEVRARDLAEKHPDQTIGGSLLDLTEAVAGPDWHGEELVQDGICYRLLPKGQAAKRRSAATLTRCTERLEAAGTIKVLTRTVQIETERYKGPTDLTYIHAPGMERKTPAELAIAILPPPGKKAHGGRKTITVPAAVAQQPHPVKRERELVESFFSLIDGALIGKPKVTPLGVDHWTNAGEELTAEEVAQIQVKSGITPAPPPPRQIRIPAYVPAVVPQIQVERREPFNVCVQDDDRGGCPDCGSPIEIGGYCAAHFAEQRRRYAGAFDYAAGAG